MATKRWVGRAARVSQAGTITIGTYDVATTYTVGIPNTSTGKTISTLGTGGTNITTAAALASLLQACLEPEFLEVTWTTPTTAVISYSVPANLAGTPVTVAVAVSGGAGTISTATTQVNVSPNDLTNANNWDGGVAPANNDTLVFDAGSVSVLWNLDGLAAVTGLTIIRRRDYTGQMALPEYNLSGYLEYRATEFQTAGGTFNIEQSGNDQPGQFKFNGNAAAMTGNVVGESVSTGRLRQEALWIRGTNAGNAFNFEQATAAVAPVDNQAATIATLRCQGSSVRCGQGVTFQTSILNYNSELEVNSNLPASGFTQIGSQALTWVKGAATANTPSVQDGVMNYMSSGTLTAPAIGTDATIDFSLDNRARTVAGTVTMNKNATYRDPSNSTLGASVAFLYSNCDSTEANVIFGPGRTATWS